LAILNDYFKKNFKEIEFHQKEKNIYLFALLCLFSSHNYEESTVISVSNSGAA
jgi:hypothetical protein